MRRLVCLTFFLLLCLIVSSEEVQQKPTMATIVQNFIKWAFEKEGVEAKQITITDIGESEGRLGVFAQSDISKDSTIMRYSATEVINAWQAHSIEDLEKFIKESSINEVEIIALYLLYERKNPQSRWKPYLDLLPNKFHSAAYLSDEILENELKGTEIVPILKKRKEALRSGYDHISRTIFERYPSIFKDESEFSFDDFLWATSVVFSRNIVVPILSRTGTWKKFNTLVPLIDLINTGYPDDINAVCQTSSDSNYIECLATKDIPKGDEIIRKYSQGGLTNVELLLDYGVTFEQNILDKVNVVIPEIIVSDQEVRHQILNSVPGILHQYIDKDTHTMEYFTLKWNEPITDLKGLFTVMRVITLSSKELENSVKFLVDKVAEGKVSNRNERAMCDKLIEILDSKLKTYKNTIEEDEALLDELFEKNDKYDANIDLRNAVVYRLAEKRLLQYHIELLQEHKKSFDKKEKTKNQQQQKEKEKQGKYKINPSWSREEL